MPQCGPVLPIFGGKKVKASKKFAQEVPLAAPRTLSVACARAWVRRGSCAGAAGAVSLKEGASNTLHRGGDQDAVLALDRWGSPRTPCKKGPPESAEGRLAAAARLPADS